MRGPLLSEKGGRLDSCSLWGVFFMDYVRDQDGYKMGLNIGM